MKTAEFARWQTRWGQRVAESHEAEVHIRQLKVLDRAKTDSGSQLQKHEIQQSVGPAEGFRVTDGDRLDDAGELAQITRPFQRPELAAGQLRQARTC